MEARSSRSSTHSPSSWSATTSWTWDRERVLREEGLWLKEPRSPSRRPLHRRHERCGRSILRWVIAEAAAPGRSVNRIAGREREAPRAAESPNDDEQDYSIF